jgi:hypothetical protein
VAPYARLQRVIAAILHLEGPQLVLEASDGLSCRHGEALPLRRRSVYLSMGSVVCAQTSYWLFILCWCRSYRSWRHASGQALTASTRATRTVTAGSSIADPGPLLCALSVR